MGRYYSGDIDGKFWFGVQGSDDADHFGSLGSAPNYLNYYFDKEHLPDIKKGIKECTKGLGSYKARLDEFFKREGGYNDQMLVDRLGVPKSMVRKLLELYARLELGKKILECVEKCGECTFEAEL